MRILAIGDIHGCTKALDTLLEAIQLQPGDLLITLGDYVDRGPDSKGVIDRLITLHQMGQLVALRGNHELAMLKARFIYEYELNWHNFWGKETLLSYSSMPGKIGNLKDIPNDHWHFIENLCVDYWETDTHFFVHANANPNLPLNKQSQYSLFYERFPSVKPHVSGKVMVCGHTSQKSGKPVNIGYAICIDTRVYDQRWLTCLEVNSGRVWQTNQSGNLRTAWIDEFLVKLPS